MITTWATACIIETANARNVPNAAPQEPSASKGTTASNVFFTTKSSYPEYAKIWEESLTEEGILSARSVKPGYPVKIGFRQLASLFGWQADADSSVRMI